MRRQERPAGAVAPARMPRRSVLALPFAAAVAAALAELGCGPGRERPPGAPDGRAAAPPAGRSILVLGGTKFLGPPVVEAARARGHTVTLFNRGKTNPHLFPDVEKLHGDREGELAALRGRRWDAVIDTSGQLPRHVRASATALRDAAHLYLFVSSISAYRSVTGPGADEGAPLVTLADPADERSTPESYGGHKALCERAAEEAMPGRVAVVRPGLIVGPGDETDRFTYWPVRVARGGEVLAPGAPGDPVQIVDVRDLGAWLVHLASGGTTGIFNAVGPDKSLSMGGLLDACAAAAGGDPQRTWVDARFLEQSHVSPWSDMPVWVPPAGEDGGMTQLSNARATRAGLTFRPVVDTARDTLAWFRTLPADRQAKLHAGLTPEREAAVLAAWHAR